MKKFLCIAFCALFMCVSLVGCSSTITPTSTAYWKDGEVLTYDVRKASDYELSTMGISSDYKQILPSSVDGTFTTKVTADTEETYTLETTLATTETYTLADFGVDTALFEQAKTLAETSQDDVLYFDGQNLKVDVTIFSLCTFNKKTFLPTNSTKIIKNIVFLHSSVVNGKTYDATYSINDVNCTTAYDYSAKKPTATVVCNQAEGETSYTLKKSSSLKTYDNEQLLFLLRSFSLEILKNNMTTNITLFDALSNSQPHTLAINVGSTPNFNYMIGGTWTGMDKSNNFTYLQTEDGQQYTDQAGNVVQVTERPVSVMSLSTGGTPILYYFDYQNIDSVTFKNTLIRMQNGYIVCDITPESLATI